MDTMATRCSSTLCKKYATCQRVYNSGEVHNYAEEGSCTVNSNGDTHTLYLCGELGNYHMYIPITNTTDIKKISNIKIIKETIKEYNSDGTLIKETIREYSLDDADTTDIIPYFIKLLDTPNYINTPTSLPWWGIYPPYGGTCDSVKYTIDVNCSNSI